MTCTACGTQIVDGARFCPRCGASAPSAQSPVGARDEWAAAGPTFAANSRIGRTIEGKYRLDALLGEGGMGCVYRATRLLIGDSVAIKILHTETMHDPNAIERFRREAQAAARLKHPNVVAIYDFGVGAADSVYLVMELADGEDLRALIERRGKLSLSLASELLDQICSALDEAHQRDIVHRDLKPENILVRSTGNGYRVKVLDFGIAKLRDLSTTSATLTQAGTVIGTPAYMSPEQCRGREVDSRSDIYSLGIILYEMLTGSVPFYARHSAEVVALHVSELPPPPSARNPSIPQAVESVVMRALQKKPEARQQSAGEFAKELSTAVRAANASPQSTEAMPLAPAPMTVPVAQVSTSATTPPAPSSPSPSPLAHLQEGSPLGHLHGGPAYPPQPVYAPTAMEMPGRTVPQQAPPEAAKSGMPAVLKVLVGVVLLAIGVGLGIGAKYAIERFTADRAGSGVPNSNSDVSGGKGGIDPLTNTNTGVPPSSNVLLPPVKNENTAANRNTNTAVPNENRNTGGGTRTGRVTSSKVTVRDSPSIRGAAVGLLDSGERVEVLAEQENTNANEGVIAREARFSGDSAGSPSTLPSGRGVIILRDAGDSFYVETTDRGRTIRGYVFKRDVTSGEKTWFRVRSAGGKAGWVNAQFIAVDP